MGISPGLMGISHGEALGEGALTVSTASVGIADGSGTTSVPGGAEYCIFYNRAGGSVYYNAESAPVAAGGNGDMPMFLDDAIIVTGNRDMTNIRFIKLTGEADSTLSYVFYGNA